MSVTPDDIPKKVDRYVIIEAIGFGAMGAVYKAEDPLIKRTVAIKTIRLDVPPHSPHYQTFLQRFYKEARISGQLSHPNIVTLYDIGETENRIPFLAMEYVEGETVDDMLSRGERLRPEQVVGLVSQMASAIDYAHSKGVIHRDIKPSNVIVYNGEKVKITDFGIAKMMDAEGTQTASLLGTPSYMSPEQAMGEELDGRTDIFSLAVVAFEMLSGQQPFPGNNVTSVLYKLVHTDPVRPENLQVLGLLPDKWHEVFSKALAKDPAERHETASAFVADLELCLGSWFGSLEGETVIMSTASPPPVESRSGSEQPVDEDSAGADQETLSAGSSPTPVEASRPTSDAHEVLAEDREDGDETVTLTPGAYRATPEASQTSPDLTTLAGAIPAPCARPIPSTAGEREGVGKEETTQWMAEDTRTLAPEAASVADSSRTVELKKSESEKTQLDGITTERTSASRSRQRRGSAVLTVPWGKKHWIVAASLLALAWVVAAVGFWSVPGELPPVQAPSPLPPVEAVPIPGSLAIGSSPEGAIVLINGNPRGVTPLEIQGVELGSYTVRIEKRGFQSAELPAVLTQENPEVRLEVDLKQVAPPEPSRATVQIDSEPAGAQATIDGRSIGMTPIRGYPVPAGERTIRLELEGYEPWERAWPVRAGMTETISVRLQPIGRAPPGEPVPQLPVGELVERGPDVVDPKCMECPGPRYPEAAKEAKMQGTVVISFTVNENGGVQDIRIEESGGGLLDQAVIKTVEHWQFEPATKNGVRVKVRMPSRRFRFIHR